MLLGILAHVDAGKTTLTEALLYTSGAIRSQGRVDHRNTFLDTDTQERERGITIYSKPARLTYKSRALTLIDTPGHTDFAGEAERTLSVLDAAILLISASDGVQGHTLTLWKLLESYGIPTFIFVNKMDMPGCEKGKLLNDIRRQLSKACFDADSDSFFEECASLDEALIEKFFDKGTLENSDVAHLVAVRRLFPCLFGSALKIHGIDRLLDTVISYTAEKTWPDTFSARVYKIARDSRGERLAFMKITGGSLKVRALVGNRAHTQNDALREEKVAAIRLYSGEKYTAVNEVSAGEECAVTGLTQVLAGDVLGEDECVFTPQLEGVFSYKVILPEGCDPHKALGAFKQLEEEDPLLRVRWTEAAAEISVQLMGDVQLEILTRVLHDRFGLDVGFSQGSILYKETIASTVEGVGHYEPLRHYAEVHLLMEPAPRGSGIRIKSAVSVDELALSWQRLIFTHLSERQFAGVLTASPLTDVCITLIAGRAHLKHTEGGDFRQATYRAVRQGLMQAKSVLLEPWYSITITLPREQLGRLINDTERMQGRAEPCPDDGSEMLTVIIHAPVRCSFGYARELAAYTKGRGRISFEPEGYSECGAQDEIVAAIGYDPERDIDNPADSVFCSHGAGVLVKWKEAAKAMHIQTGALREESSEKPVESHYRPTGEGMDEELKAIFERTYGKIERKMFDSRPPARPLPSQEPVTVMTLPPQVEYLLVDGYNIIFAWEELNSAAQISIESARTMLIDILANYAGHMNIHVILVFDAYKVKRNPGSVEKSGALEIVYTKEAETADSYIEKLTYEISRRNRVRVATSDGMEQLIILGNGALRMSAQELRREVDASNTEIRSLLDKLNIKRANGSMRKAFDDAERRNQ